MDRDSNKYNLIFASVLVVLVAVILSITHEILKDKQQQNANIDKMEQILRSVKIEVPKNEVEQKFKDVVTNMYMIDTEGNIIPNSKDVVFEAEMKVEMSKPFDKRQYPVYEVEIDGAKKYILALYGKGLWGPIWGYIAVNADGNSIYGIDISHASETPGLGAEIALSWFADRFIGKELFKNGQFKSVAVVKHGKVPIGQDYVDGISGGTITSHGVDHMLLQTLEGYSKFLTELQD